jgi:hypothetical protein
MIREVRRWLASFTDAKAKTLYLAAREKFATREHAEPIARMVLQLQLKHRELMGDAITATSRRRTASVAALTRPLLESAVTLSWVGQAASADELYARTLRVLAAIARQKDVERLEPGWSAIIDARRDGTIKGLPNLAQLADAVDGPDGFYATAYKRHYTLLSTFAHPTAQGPAVFAELGEDAELHPRGRHRDRIGALHLGSIYFRAAYVELCALTGLAAQIAWSQERHVIAIEATNAALLAAMQADA